MDLCLDRQQTCQSWNVLSSWLFYLKYSSSVSFYQVAISTALQSSFCHKSIQFSPPPLSASLSSPCLLRLLPPYIFVHAFTFWELTHISYLHILISILSPYQPSPSCMLLDCVEISQLVWGNMRKRKKWGKTGINHRLDWPTADWTEGRRGGWDRKENKHRGFCEWVEIEIYYHFYYSSHGLIFLFSRTSVTLPTLGKQAQKRNCDCICMH